MVHSVFFLSSLLDKTEFIHVITDRQPARSHLSPSRQCFCLSLDCRALRETAQKVMAKCLELLWDPPTEVLGMLWTFAQAWKLLEWIYRGERSGFGFELDSRGWPDASAPWHASGTKCWSAECSWWLSLYPRPPCTDSGRVKNHVDMKQYVLVSFWGAGSPLFLSSDSPCQHPGLLLSWGFV